MVILVILMVCSMIPTTYLIIK